MTGQFFFSLLNPMVAFFIAGAFALLLRRWPGHAYLLPLSLGFAYVGLAFLTQDFHLLSRPDGVNFSGNALFVAAVLLACCAVLVRARVRVPTRTFLLICGVAAAAFVWLVFGHPSRLGRILVINGTFVAVISITLALLLRARPRGVADHLFITATVLALLLSVARPIFAVTGMLDINSGGDFLASAYWANVQAFTPMVCLVLAALFALAMALDIIAQLRHDAEHDYLTGLLNRRGFETSAAALLEGEAADASPAVLLADIDDFKKVNDRFGHQTGDRVIAHIGRILAAHGAATLAARTGGEEFALFYLVTDPPTLAARAAAIQDELRSARIAGLPPSYPLTLSIGLHRHAAGERLEDMLKGADGALYRAKSEGKNRAVTSHRLSA